MTENTDSDEDESRPKYGIRCGVETVKKTREALGESESEDTDDE